GVCSLPAGMHCGSAGGSFDSLTHTHAHTTHAQTRSHSLLCVRESDGISIGRGVEAEEAGRGGEGGDGEWGTLGPRRLRRRRGDDDNDGADNWDGGTMAATAATVGTIM